jgi:hypothetical protein
MGEKTGEIEFRLREDGSIMKKWELAKKKNMGSRVNLLRGVSTPHVVCLLVSRCIRRGE